MVIEWFGLELIPCMVPRNGLGEVFVLRLESGFGPRGFRRRGEILDGEMSVVVRRLSIMGLTRMRSNRGSMQSRMQTL